MTAEVTTEAAAAEDGGEDSCKTDGTETVTS